MIHPIDGNNGPKPVAPKRSNPVNQNVKRDYDSAKVHADRGDVVEISNAAVKQHQNALLIEKARSALEKQSEIRESETSKAAQHVKQGILNTYNAKVNHQVIDEMIQSDDLRDVLLNWGIKNKLAELESEDYLEQLAQIREKIAAEFYDNEQTMEKVVDYLVQLFFGQ